MTGFFQSSQWKERTAIRLFGELSESESVAMSLERVLELRQQAQNMDDSGTKLAVLEEAIREADSLGETGLAYDLRMDLIRAAEFSGYKERSIVAFSWCLSQYDATPEDYSQYSLLWRYKWILTNLPSFPQIPTDQILRMHEDYERRLTEQGYSLRPGWGARWQNEAAMGDFTAANETFGKWKDAPRDLMADCRACDRRNHVWFLIDKKQDVDALRLAQPILDGEMFCATVPHTTLGDILTPLMRLNQLDDAKAYHLQGYRKVANSRNFLDTACDHLLFVVHIGDFSKAVRLFQKHLPWALETFDLDTKHYFCLSSVILLEALVNRGNRSRKLQLPATFPLHRENGSYRPSELLEWFTSETGSLATRFDERNGNPYFSEKLEYNRELVLGAS